MSTLTVEVGWDDGARVELAAACSKVASGSTPLGEGGHVPGPADVPSDEAVRRIVAATFREAGRFLDGDGVVGVRWCTLAASSRLNLQHRGLSDATDVLSFPGELDSPFPGAGGADGMPAELGDLAICPAYVAGQLADGSTMLPHGPGQDHGDDTLRAALERCIVHGTLHLLGHDHELGEDAAREMFELEQGVIEGVRASRWRLA